MKSEFKWNGTYNFEGKEICNLHIIKKFFKKDKIQNKYLKK